MSHELKENITQQQCTALKVGVDYIQRRDKMCSSVQTEGYAIAYFEQTHGCKGFFTGVTR